METLSFYVYFVFGFAVLLAIYLFSRAIPQRRAFLAVVVAWIAIQTIAGAGGFYQNTHTNPPRFLFLILPPLSGIILLFATRRGRDFIDSLDIRWLTLFHIIRLPVELVLFWLCARKAVPVLMTFEGRNFDIVSGVTAPIIYYVGFIRKQPHRRILLAWNMVCLGLLLNVVVHAILSLPTSFQQFALDQPNIAVLPATLIQQLSFN